MMRNKGVKLGFILMALLAVTGLAACNGSPTVAEPEKFTVTRGSIVQSVTADGVLSLPLDRTLSFGTSGKIDQIKVDEGDKVTKGAVLAKLETSALERAVKTAELALSSTDVDRKQAEFSIKAAELDLEQASDSFRKITYPYTYSTFVFDVPAALDYISSAGRQIGDARKSFQTGMTTDQYNEIARQLKDAEDNLTNARERLARGTGQDVFASNFLAVKDFWTLRAAQLQKDKAQAALDNVRNVASKVNLAADKAKYDLDTARDMLDKAIITAPFDGVVARVTVKAGDTLTAVDYTKTIIELVDSRHIELTIYMDETDIPGIKLGQETAIRIDAMPDSRLSGKVIFISPLSQVQAGVVRYEVKVGFDVPEDSGLKSGMSSRADIITARRSDVPVLPSRALAKSSTGDRTVKLLVDGQVAERKIVTGISDGVNTEIVSGLKENDIVVIERGFKLSLS